MTAPRGAKELYTCTEIENPAFDLDEGYDTTTTSNEYHLIDPSEPRLPTVYKENIHNVPYTHKVTFTRVTCTCRRIVTFVVAILAVVAVAVAIYFIVQTASKQKRDFTEYDSNSVSGTLRIINIAYVEDYGDATSKAYQALSSNMTSELAAVMVASSLGGSYTSTSVTALKKGSVIVDFEYSFNKVFKTTDLEYEVEQEFFTHTKTNKNWDIVLNGYIIERESIHFSAEPLPGLITTIVSRPTDELNTTVVPRRTTPKPLSSCQPVSPAVCRDPRQVAYGLASFPNMFGQSAQQAVAAMRRARPLATSQCYRYAARFLCALYWPRCDTEQQAAPPCARICDEFFLACSSEQMPPEVKSIVCADFPLGGTAECTNVPVEAELPVRLVGGSTAWEGRVQVYVGGVWGAVCDVGWSELEAKVVCRQLNYSGVAKERVSGYFGSGSDEMVMTDVYCGGSERHLTLCRHTSGPGVYCPHFASPAGVTCNFVEASTATTTKATTTATLGMRVRLVGGPTSRRGRVEVSYEGGPWGTICRHMFRDAAAEVICNMLDFRDGEARYEHSRYGAGEGAIWLNNVHCIGTEPSVLLCQHDPWRDLQNSGECSHLDDVSIACDAVPTTAVRTTSEAASTSTAAAVTTTTAYVAPPSERPQTTSALTSAMTSAQTSTMTSEWTTASISPTTSPQGGYRVQLVGPSAVEGRVEVYHNGTWGTICEDGFDNNDAAVICRMMGLSGHARVLNRDPTGAFGPVWITDVTCSGDESSLSECDHSAWGDHHCDHNQDVFITCDAPDSPVRLVGGDSGREGLVEIFYNNTWGTVCSDEFDDRDARTICRSLGFKGNTGKYVQQKFGAGTGPIWLESLRCLGDEVHVTDCRHDGWGVHNCEHAEDVSISCPPPSAACQPITVPMCARHISWNMTSLPNAFGHTTQKEAADHSYAWAAQVSVHCHPVLQEFLCTLYTPRCTPGSQHTPLKPCRPLCREIQQRCGGIIADRYPRLLDCDTFPVGQKGIDCADVKDISTDDDVTAATSRDPPADNGTTASYPKSDPEPEWPTTLGSPTDARSEDAGSYPATTAAQPGDAHRGGPAGGDVSTQRATPAQSMETTTTGTTTTTTTTTITTTTTERPTTTREAETCERITVPECSTKGMYQYTHLPNSFHQSRQSDVIAALNRYGVSAHESIDCHDNVRELACSVFLPKCTPDGHGIQIWEPCLDFCEDVRRKCESLLAAFQIPWPIACDDYPKEQPCYRP